MNAIQQTAVANLIQAFEALNDSTDHTMKLHCANVIKNAREAIGEKILIGIYHETLSDAVEAAKNEIKINGAVLAENATACFTPMAIGETQSRSYPIETLKGKPTKKWAHVSIYRLDSGNYEQTNYIL